MVTISDPANNQPDGPRVFLVTGATGAIGKAIARQLAANLDSEVVLVCRDKDKAEKCRSGRNHFEGTTPGGPVKKLTPENSGK